MKNKLKRYSYEFKKYGLTGQNEPSEDLILSCNCRLYPDMKRAYDRFSELLEIDPDRFILANGGENAMKMALLALKPKTMAWFLPTWKMPEVYCAALDIKPIKLEFKRKLNKDIYAPLNTPNCDIFYSNMGKTSLFTYEAEKELLGFYPNCKFQILDLTYKNFEEIKQTIHNNYPKNTIFVGSFDKLAGCGLRLGFVIYPKELNDEMQLQREQYINMCAYEWLININRSQLKFLAKNPIEDFLEENCLSLESGWSITDNYITIPKYIDAHLNEVHFTIEEQSYTRFGQPNNDIEKRLLFPIIKKALFE